MMGQGIHRVVIQMSVALTCTPMSDECAHFSICSYLSQKFNESQGVGTVYIANGLPGEGRIDPIVCTTSPGPDYGAVFGTTFGCSDFTVTTAKSCLEIQNFNVRYVNKIGSTLFKNILGTFRFSVV
jgi:hypothetical protein